MPSFVVRIDEPEQPQPPHAAFPKTVWGLEIVRGQARQMFRPIPGPVFMIGTAVDCDLVLADAAFPETYLYLYIKDDAVSIRRFGVGPELFVDEVETDVAELPLGSVIQFGPYAFRLAQQTGGGRGPDNDRPDPAPDDELELTTADVDCFEALDFAAWKRDDSAAIDKVRALLADVRASLQPASRPATIRVYSPKTPPIDIRRYRRQSA
jgi:hypothetical protein